MSSLNVSQQPNKELELPVKEQEELLAHQPKDNGTRLKRDATSTRDMINLLIKGKDAKAGVELPTLSEQKVHVQQITDHQIPRMNGGWELTLKDGKGNSLQQATVSPDGHIVKTSPGLEPNEVRYKWVLSAFRKSGTPATQIPKIP